MQKQQLSRKQLSSLFRIGAERKEKEIERFNLLALEDPTKSKKYQEIAKYLAIDKRYYDLASYYYAEDFEHFENTQDEDLLTLIDKSELSPRMYAEYLRLLPPADKGLEEVTHQYILGLKGLICSMREGSL